MILNFKKLPFFNKSDQIQKEIINILISNRHLRMDQLLLDDIGLGLKNKYRTFPTLVTALDEVLYILNKLEKLGYIKVKLIINTSNMGGDFFNEIPIETEGEKVDITVNRLQWFIDYIKEIYYREITVESGLIEYIRNNYRTHEEINWQRTRNLSVFIALITSILTSILTALLTNPSTFYCLGYYC